MTRQILATLGAALAFHTLPIPAAAQQPTTPAARITRAEAGKAMDAAEGEAQRNNWKLTFVIADAAGTPIYVRRMDGATKQSYDIAMNKISTSITSGMHTVDYVAAVRANRIPAIEGAFMYEGGMLMKRDGAVIGAFSASGARGSEDAQAVKAGMAAIGIAP